MSSRPRCSSRHPQHPEVQCARPRHAGNNHEGWLTRDRHLMWVWPSPDATTPYIRSRG